MKRWRLFGLGGLLLCGVLALGAADKETGERGAPAVETEAAQKAEQTLPPLVAWAETYASWKDYANLQLLQHLSGPEIERLMGFFAETMGQKCRFCHNIRDYARDEKPMKAQGRKMIQLVQHLNREWFGSERITCYTCHDATAEAALLPPGISELPPLTAGERRRQLPEDYGSVRHLTHLTEDEYDQVMNFFVQSLGQTSCRYCHNIRDYASDENEHKVRAREMIAMVQDIAPRGWSEERITCYTCHAGEEHPRQFPEGWTAAPIPGNEPPGEDD